MGGDAQQLASDAPGEKPRDGPGPQPFEQAPARSVELAALVRGLEPGAGVDGEHAIQSRSRSAYSASRPKMSTRAPPPIQRGSGKGLLRRRRFIQHSAEARLDELGHGDTTLRSLLAQAPEHGVIDGQRDLSMVHHTTRMEVQQADGSASPGVASPPRQQGARADGRTGRYLPRPAATPAPRRGTRTWHRECIRADAGRDYEDLAGEEAPGAADRPDERPNRASLEQHQSVVFLP
jgi:hypothetical protein